MSTRFQNVKKQTRPNKPTQKAKKEEVKTEESQVVTKKKEAEKNLRKILPNKPKVTPNKNSSTLSPSGRVSKSQFYPNKEVMYKNALKENKNKTAKDRDRNTTRTLSPSEIKVLKPKEEPSTSSDNNVSNIKRPGTATIKKSTEEETYESDFDSYESDFEEYLSSAGSTISISTEDDLKEVKESKPPPKDTKDTTIDVEEEKKLDSGTYEMTEANKHKQVLSNIIESIENENNSLIPKSNTGNLSNLTSLSDEGFEEIKNEKVHFVNFLEAKRRTSLIKYAEIKRKRGQELLSMIQLDNQNFAIFEMQPVPYDVFMKFYGKQNYIQSSIQTADDDVDEEVETDKIEMRSIWTQHPAKLAISNFGNLTEYRKDFLGVGCPEENNGDCILKYNEGNLNSFLKITSEAILTLLEERSQQTNCNDIENNDKRLPFSDGHITFNTNLEFLKNMKITSATFSENTTKILTVHNSIENERSLLCLWKISDQNTPEKVFSIYGYIDCCNIYNVTVFAGLNDGTISIWKSDYIEISTSDGYIPPIFISDIQKGHNTKIVSIISVNNSDQMDQNSNLQVYTLDEDGLLIIWSVIELQKHDKVEINLHLNSEISFKKMYSNFGDLQCTEMCVSKLDPTHIFVTTNYGNVLHFATTGSKCHPRHYSNKSKSALTVSNCITNSPFSPLYFLCGYQDGNVILFSRKIEKPLMVMSNTNEESGIDFVEWSVNKPCIFYTKDNKNNIHIWDLTKSDIFPIYSVNFKEKVDFIKLSPGLSENNTIKRSYMIIITNNDTISLYILNKDHGQQDKKDYEDNIRKFTNYVNRL